MTTCELCKRKKKTKWHFEDEDWWIVSCETCDVPMAVYKEHTMRIPLHDVIYITHIIYETFGDVSIRFSQRKIKKHFHFHIL